MKKKNIKKMFYIHIYDLCKLMIWNKNIFIQKKKLILYFKFKLTVKYFEVNLCKLYFINIYANVNIINYDAILYYFVENNIILILSCSNRYLLSN